MKPNKRIRTQSAAVAVSDRRVEDECIEVATLLKEVGRIQILVHIHDIVHHHLRECLIGALESTSTAFPTSFAPTASAIHRKQSKHTEIKGTCMAVEIMA